MNNSFKSESRGPESLTRFGTRVCLGLTLLAVALSQMPAASAALLLSAGSTTLRNDADAVVGYEFEVGATPYDINALGFIDEGLDGLLTAHDVGLWTTNATPTLLASVTVPSGTAGQLIGDWRYAMLPSTLTLAANQHYVLGALVTNGGDQWRDYGTVTTDPDISMFQRRYVVPVFSLTYPNAGPGPGVDTNDGYIAPNATFIIPEPSGALLLAVGGLLFWRQRR